MTAMFVAVSDVRAYLDIEGVSGKYSDGLIGSNIRAAGAFLERTTNRQFENQLATTKTFSTNGGATMAIPDLRTLTSVTLQDVALVSGESYWAIGENGITTTIQFRPFGNGGDYSYKGNPSWFDRNLDRYPRGTALPNDLVIVGDWGYDPLPEDLLHATKVLAAYYTKRPASVLADVAITAEGNELRYGQLPIEVREFLANWTAGPVLAAI